MAMMTFGEAVATCFRKYVVFSGRARRPEYWWFALFATVAGIVLAIVDGAVFGVGEQSPQVLSALFGLATFIPRLSVSWRRMHDVGRPGYAIFAPLLSLPLLLLGFLLAETSPQAGRIVMVLFAVAAIGLSILVFVWLVSPSQSGPNKYGPEPGAEVDVRGVFE